MSEPVAALEGIVVVDLGHHVAAPLAAMLLADQGATVIKVERGDRALAPHPFRSFVDRGKRAVRLDLASASGRDGVRDLLRNADVVVEGFRPGVADRLGFGAQQLRELNPGLIHVSLPGFASSEQRSRVRAWEGIVGAATGLYTDISAVRPTLGLGPVFTALPLPSIYGGMHGALAAVMALIERGSSGLGQAVEVPLASAAMSALGGILFRAEQQPWRYDIPPVPHVLSRYALPAVRALIRWSGRRGHDRALSSSQRLFPPLMASYRCQDDRLLFIYALDHARFPLLLLEHLGLRETLEHQGLTVESPWAAPGSRTNLCDSGILKRSLQAVVRAEIARVLRTKPAARWERELNEVGVPCAVQRSCDEWVDSLREQDPSLLAAVDDPEIGTVVGPGRQVWLGRSAAPFAPEPCRTIEIGAAIQLAEEVRSRSVPFAPTSSGARGEGILAGVRVLDLSNVIAGPACARTLAEYGAEVIKIDSPEPLQGLRVSRAFAMDLQRGKSSIFLDLKRPTHRDAFHALLGGADVVVHNFRAGAIDGLAIAHDQLVQHNPGIVSARVSAYGSAAGGARSSWPGFDPVLQAASGIMVRYGSRDAPELHAIASCIDFLTGHSAALGVALALFARGRDPQRRGDSVETSLAQSASLIQAPFVVQAGRGPATEPSGQRALGEGPLRRMVRTSDGWIFVAAADHQAAHLDDIRLGGLSCAAAIADLSAHDVAAHAVTDLASLRSEQLAEPGDGYVARDAPSVVVIRQQLADGQVLHCAAPTYARFERTRLRIGAPPSLPGHDTRRVLEAAGIAPDVIDEIDADVRRGAAYLSRFLPA